MGRPEGWQAVPTILCWNFYLTKGLLMQFFDNESFKDFLGLPIYEGNHIWGVEKRFSVVKDKIKDFVPIFRNTLYRHHSSFNIADELSTLGFPLSAEAMRIRNSGLPTDEKTRMGNIGEVLGAEFASAYLNYQTTIIFPKRLNPNPDQSMKGVDILGLRDQNLPAEILLGEVKSYTKLDNRAISEAYINLKNLHQNKKLPVIFHFAKEYLNLQQNSSQAKNIDRHMAEDAPKNCFLLSITQKKPRNPFSVLPQSRDVQLLTVHIQLEDIRSFLPVLFA
jgi:hypothetical protein